MDDPIVATRGGSYEKYLVKWKNRFPLIALGL